MLLVENVKKSYRQTDGTRLPILDVPSLQVAAGEQVVIRGRSGGGKTTFLNVIAGLATPDEGRVVIQTTDLTKLPEFVRCVFSPGKRAAWHDLHRPAARHATRDRAA